MSAKIRADGAPAQDAELQFLELEHPQASPTRCHGALRDDLQ
jgi:hypothetical protein